MICIDPTLAAHPNFTLMTGAYVSKLETDPSGRTVSRVHVSRDGREEQYSADIVVVACGALSSALLLLRSASDSHPRGLANGSDQVGRNYMRHNMSILMALLQEPNRTVFQKTLAVSDYYFHAPDWDYPLGLIQMCATSHGEQIRGEALPSWLSFAPETPFEVMAEHSIDFWLQSEDLPRPENRVYYDGDKVVLDLSRTTRRPRGASNRSSRICSSPSGRTSICSSEASSSARTSRSAAPRTRPGPAASGPIRRPRS